MNMSANDTLTLTRICNREEHSCIRSFPELCPARDNRAIKNAPLENKSDSAAATLAHSSASVAMRLERSTRSRIRIPCVNFYTLMFLKCLKWNTKERLSVPLTDLVFAVHWKWSQVILNTNVVCI